MVVNGMEITQAIIDACLARMKNSHFRSFQIQGVVERLGVPEKNGSSMRVADRIVQRERKAGNIELTTARQWRWVGKTA